jgi:hypothetical protein
MSAHWRRIVSAFLLLMSGSAALASQIITLGSGKSVEILSVGPLQSTQGWSSLMLKYRTSIPLDQLATLRQEADEIWERLVVDAERGHYPTAVISAGGPEQGGIIKTGKSYNFVFEKRDASWRTFESKERAQAKLDESFVKEFVDRLDRSLEENNMNAALLYLADDWTMTVTNPGDASQSQTMDRMKFAAISHATFAAARSRSHHRDIVSIAIGQGGAAAQVDSRETEAMTINDHQIAGVERSTDLFELRGDVMLWTRSTSVIEKQSDTKSP